MAVSVVTGWQGCLRNRRRVPGRGRIMEGAQFITGQGRPVMTAKEKEIQAFVRQCTQLRRLIQDGRGLTEEQCRFIKSHLETILTDMRINRKRREVRSTV